VKLEVRAIQHSFRKLEWIAPLPPHFLHVSVGVTQELDLDAASLAWAGMAPFPVVYQRVNCFHEAVIVEAHTQGVAALVERALPEVDRSVLLPHVSIGYTRRREAADPLRPALRRFRDVHLGTGLADTLLLCEVPVGKSTLLQPWRVLGSVELRG
jgi:hypothetical protein